MTPIPVPDLHELMSSVKETEGIVSTIRDMLLPQTMKQSTDARDMAHDALEMVRGHVGDEPLHSHPCEESVRQNDQDEKIVGLATKLATATTKTSGNSQMLWWLLGAIAAVLTAATGFAVAVETDVVRNSTSLESHTKQLSEHDTAIKMITETQTKDRETYIKEVHSLPGKITEAIQEANVQSVESVADDLPLTKQEQLQLRQILETARLRSVNH